MKNSVIIIVLLLVIFITNRFKLHNEKGNKG